MMRFFTLPYLLLGISVMLMSCSTMKDTGPDDYLNRARELLQAKEYQSAKLYLDSIRILFPKDYDKIREGMTVMREVNFSEQQRTLEYCDSLLKVRQNELPAASQGFVFLKNAEYESIGHYVPKTQVPEKNFGRTFLQSKVDEKGRLVLTSYYCGSSVLNHTKIKAMSKNGLFAETMEVPKDGALNYSFKDGDLQYEIVRFGKKTENGVVNYILMHMNSPVTIFLSGVKNKTYTLTSQDKQALKASTNLSSVLNDINHLLDEIRLAQAKLEYINSKQKNKSVVLDTLE